MFKLIKSFLQKLYEIIYPPLCLKCKKILTYDAGLCSECWNKIEFITDPLCDQCGYPLSYEGQKNGALCAKCIQKAPLFTKARAVFSYKEGGRVLISQFKLHDKLHYEKLFTRWMAPLFTKELMDENSDEEEILFVPVPMHPFKLFLRRYNQAAILAKALGEKLDLPFSLEALKRTRLTKVQGGMRAAQRRRNVKNAFSINPKIKNELEGRAIILIDDVYTTGATIEACAKPLLKAGVKEVKVLTLARTLLG